MKRKREGRWGREKRKNGDISQVRNSICIPLTILEKEKKKYHYGHFEVVTFSNISMTYMVLSTMDIDNNNDICRKDI